MDHVLTLKRTIKKTTLILFIISEMERLRAIEDSEIQEKVESLVGKGTRVIGCEKSTSFHTEEILLVNGFPVPINGQEGTRIKEALLSGQVPQCELLNEILMRAGILKKPVELETTMNTRTSTKTTEVLTLRDKNGFLIDERLKEVKEDNEHKSTSTEVWKQDESKLHNSSVVDRLAKCVDKVNFKSNSGVATKLTSGITTSGSSSGNSSGSSSGLNSPYNTQSSTPTTYCMDYPNSIMIKSPASPSPRVSTLMNHSCSTQSSHSSGISEASCSISEHSTVLPCSSHELKHKTCMSTAGINPNYPAASNRFSVQEKATGKKEAGGNTENDKSAANKTTNPPKPTESESDNALVYKDRNLVSGTLDALIQHLIPTESYYPDRAYIFAFLLSSRLYIRPHDLLDRVLGIALETPSHFPKCTNTKDAIILSNVAQLLGEWAELFPFDFRNERMMAQVRKITKKCVHMERAIRNKVSLLLTSLLGRLTALERYEDYIYQSNAEANAREPRTSPSILTICPNPTMLAQQLTHIELERLSHIGAEEFVQTFAKDNPQVETMYGDTKKTKNLESYVQWFNRLSYYVATEICKILKKKNRVRVVEYWIEAARECFNIGNFNSMMAIIAGLNMSPVARLKKMWAKVNTSQLSILEHQMDPSSNFTSYRSTLKAAIWRSTGAKDERQRIIIPFFSLLVKDLHFLNEGCASRNANGHINFEKCWQFAKQVAEIVVWQQRACPFPKVQTVISSLQTAPVFGENDKFRSLCLASYECEPADNAQERERLKYLRQDEATVRGCLSTGANKEKDSITGKPNLSK